MFARPLLLLSLLPVALAGCTGTRNLGLDPIHQPVVARASYSLDVSTDADGLAPGEARRLSGWMASLRLSYGDQVAIDDPSRDPHVREAVGGEVAHFGLLLADDLPVSGAPVAPGTARVVVSRVTASVPGCPDWSRDPSHEAEGSTSSNFGCATNMNLAAMVANPVDLVHGQTGNGTSDPGTAGRAMEAMNKSAASTGASGQNSGGSIGGAAGASSGTSGGK